MPHDIRAVRIHDYGGSEMIRLDRIPCPVPQAGAVRVRARGLGINPVDWKIREGQRRTRMPLELPAVIGCDIAGEVDMVGLGVSGLAVGDPVFAMVGLHGAFAEAVVIPAAQVVRKPERPRFPRCRRRAAGRAHRMAGAASRRHIGWAARARACRVRRRRAASRCSSRARSARR